MNTSLHSDASPRLSPPRVFAFTSGKGGVGKTNIVANVAATLTGAGKQVAIIDGNLGLANLDLLLGVSPQYTVTDFFTGTRSLAEIMITTPRGIALLPAASGASELATLSWQQKLLFLAELDALAPKAQVVLLDTASGISDLVTYFASAAHEIVVVLTPEPTSLSDACALVAVLASRRREKRFWVLANMVKDEAEARQLYARLSRLTLQEFNVACDLLGWIPRDPALREAVARCQMVVETAPQSASAQAFTTIAHRLIHCTTEPARVKGGLQFFLPSLMAAHLEETR